MQCTLCPRACRAERNESTGNGFCQLPTTIAHRPNRAAPLGRTADFRQERHGRGVLLRLYAPLRLLPER